MRALSYRRILTYRVRRSSTYLRVILRPCRSSCHLVLLTAPSRNPNICCDGVGSYKITPVRGARATPHIHFPTHTTTTHSSRALAYYNLNSIRNPEHTAVDQSVVCTIDTREVTAGGYYAWGPVIEGMAVSGKRYPSPPPVTKMLTVKRWLHPRVPTTPKPMKTTSSMRVTQCCCVAPLNSRLH